MISEGDVLTVYNPYDEAIGKVTVSMISRDDMRRVWLSGEIRDPRWHPSTRSANVAGHNWFGYFQDPDTAITVNDSLNGYYAKKETP